MRFAVATCAITLAVALFVPAGSDAEVRDTLMLRGRAQSLHIYGARGSGPPVVVSSGDGGWLHLAPRVASMLAARGFFVVGFDTKAYLESFTSEKATLRPGDVPLDYRVLADYAAGGSERKPVFVGVSEGAGLSVLAAADPAAKSSVAGVIGLGLPDVNELGWRWKDAVIYLTHGVPDEPTFRTSEVARRLDPLPLAAIHATSDEFVPLAEVQRVLDAAGGPTRLWVIRASNHRFSDNPAELDRCLLEAIAWIGAPERAG
jgi:hypothetical protein